ncbi:MAG TPA: hypothetical protein PLD38_12660 [Pyrinomonadaceae bacterium]|nr:hypothetical protein [Chloracidobacterium sp.]MBP9936562.1 hypothetical protein [Pyrinomonadaceae bacterium]MBK7803946.1 hypothetical protein [Chloracidobacterium sp.]MBL0239331.1 hypothetical protein [Chloracidobacterium sp.]HQY68126.1 hypothetical protein [Pyrinomonadaceae bacterium]
MQEIRLTDMYRRSIKLAFGGIMILIASQFALSQPACSGKAMFTEPVCIGNTLSKDENALFDLVNKYRVANGQPAVKLSSRLSVVANRRMLDVKQNMRVLTHSWSNCPYDKRDNKTWPCVTAAPQRLNSGYIGEGYQTLYRTTTGAALPGAALETWRKSSLHNSIILNLSPFKDYPWDELGVAIDGQFAALWFGTMTGGGIMASEGEGLGVDLDKTISGISKLLPVGSVSSSLAGGKWQGTTADKSLKVEIFGVPKEVSEINVRLSIKLAANGKLSPANRKIMLMLLGNVFPRWTEREIWLDRTLAVIAADRKATRTQIIEKNAIEVQGSAGNSLNFAIRPLSKPAAIEIF